MKILMVCLGNICRSPMAEGIMRSKIEKYNLDAEVDSAGFESFHTGDAPDYRAIKVMKTHGIDISGQKSRLFRKTDFDDFNMIFVMDSGNFRDVQSVASTKDQMNKVDYILNTLSPGKNNAVPDPYYGGDDGFERVFKLLDSATEAISDILKSGK
jgi:protein-tyrosine phosphatase